MENGKMRADDFIALTVLGAQLAAKEVDRVKMHYIKDMEAHGEANTLEVIRSMSVDDVDYIVREFSEIGKKIDEIRDFFHSARRV